MTPTISRETLEAIQDPVARAVAADLVHRGILLVEGDPRPVTGEPGRR